LTLAYDGSPFSGWQVQPGLATVQGALADSIERVTGECVLPQGSGRTDAGVHALGQVASFPLRARIPAANLQRALNHALPPSVRVLAACEEAADFHARHSARSKLYEYRIWRGEICMPFVAPYVYACPWPLDTEAMQAAAALVMGEHDFASFAAREPDLATRRGLAADQGETGLGGTGLGEARSGCVRRILASAWDEPVPELLRYRVRGTGFLHHMVRNLVGTFLAVGRGQFEAGEIPRILAARDRSAAGPTAPARGLYLVSVDYVPVDAD
jgi:tRNA pseudouridine38-40 synthase